jgi:putative Flp pilus-assembly TadE/G-like protein
MMRPALSALSGTSARIDLLRAGFSLRQLRRVKFRRVTPRRRGAVLVLAAFFLIVFLAFVMLALDIGYILVARTELQRAADSGALAAAAELLEAGAETARNGWSRSTDNAVRQTALQFVELNRVTSKAPTVDLNQDQDPEGDIVLGEIGDWTGTGRNFRLSSSGNYSAVRVRVVRSLARNGQVPLFFGRVFGWNGANAEATATAAFVSQFRGFRAPDGPNGPENLPILPFAVEEEHWKSLLAGRGEDEWSWDQTTRRVEERNDGVPEMDFYPTDTGSSGNWGTVDIGGHHSDTPTLCRQIRDGISPTDLEYHGGELALDGGEMQLSAATGLRAAMQEALTEIVGQPRIIPIYRSIDGGGTKAQYKIVGWGGTCIVSANLEGNDKHVRIQATPIITRGGIPASSGEETSDYIFSPVGLVN